MNDHDLKEDEESEGCAEKEDDYDEEGEEVNDDGNDDVKMEEGEEILISEGSFSDEIIIEYFVLSVFFLYISTRLKRKSKFCYVI